MVFENRVLRRIFEPKRNEVTGAWIKLHNEELLTKYYASDEIEKNEMGGACRTCGGIKGVYRVLVGKTEGKRQPGSSRRRCEYSIG
jgi:hypothetical protein